MLVDYFHWQYGVAPRWLVTVAWNLQRALVQLFSVKLMLRTLLSPWHRDVAAFHGGSLSDLGLVILWNIVSRLIGLFFRLTILGLWLFAEAVYLVCVLVGLLLFAAWPALVLLGLAVGLALLFL
jgi:hypothetical protein